MKFKVGETYKTRTGREARLLHRRKKHGYPLVWVIDSGGDDKIITTTEEGRHMTTVAGGNDIRPPKPTMWVNVFNSCIGGAYTSREEADETARLGRSPRIACVRVEYREGQFDE